MPNSDAAHLNELKLARDAITAKMITDAGGTVMITIRGRTRQVTDPARTLKFLDEQIQIYSVRVARATRSPYRLAHLHPTSRVRRSQ